ncbi:alpha/beta hydrolase [Latilactobacillus fragifolii]|uniref:alpha/beta hydrolase n=1 Tax=Latilactobacillus fragifolii TaxID=2814244 RepID=UPI001ABAC1EF|nr:alpha/beta hydrolase-fold protein [Latilactobacillus fragifolii]
MTLINMQFYANTLQQTATISVILPEPRSSDQVSLTATEWPYMILLHGLGTNQSDIIRKTSIERYATATQMAIILPSLGRSCYLDSPSFPAWQFLTTELRPRVTATFKLSTNLADCFIAGISMGSYGAFRWGLVEPKRFRGIGVISGAVNYFNFPTTILETLPPYRVLINQQNMIPVDLDDLLTSELTSSVYIACGTQDDFYVDNQALAAKLTAIGQTPIFVTENIGHDWSFWDHQLQQVLHRFSNERLGTANAN